MHEHNDREAQLRKSVEKMLARISDANRPFIEARLAERTVNVRIASQAAWMNVVVQVDEALNGAPFGEVSARELAELVASWRRRKKDTTLGIHVVYLRGLWATVKGVRRPHDLPLEYLRALDVKQPERKVKGRVLSDEEIERVLQSILDHDKDSQRAFRTPMKVAAVWTLRDLGHRAREMLSLNVGDVTFKTIQDASGAKATVAKLSLREGTPNLKTGARPVAGLRCAGPLKAWLALHPRATDPKAPLFCGIRDDTGLHRWDYKELRKVIVRAGREAGVSECPEHPGKLRLHDLRHTAATEKARLGWNEQKMREYFGWKLGSDMPGYYAHIGYDDLEAQVLQDAGIDRLGRTTAKPPKPSGSMDDQAVLAALRRLLTGKE